MLTPSKTIYNCVKKLLTLDIATREQAIRTYLSQFDIEVFFAAENKQVACLRSRDRAKSYFMNGVVVGVEGVMAKPPKRLSTIRRDTFVTLDLSKYEAIHAANGTMVTLYFSGEWLLASSRSANVGRVSISGGKPVYDVFMDLIDAAGIPIANLNENLSYTFVICCAEYHMLPIESIYFICAYDRISEEYVDCPNLDQYKQESIPTGPTIESLLDICESASQRYIYGYNDYVYGVILRSNVKSDHSRDYYMPSDIMQFLKASVFSVYNINRPENEYMRIQRCMLVAMNAHNMAEFVTSVFYSFYREEFYKIEEYLERIERKYDEYCNGIQDLSNSEMLKLFGEAYTNKLSIRDSRLISFHLNLIKSLA